MNFFDTPSWDLDHGTDELFHSLNVPSNKVSKEKNGDNHPKVSVGDKPSKSTAYIKEQKSKSSKVKKMLKRGQRPCLQAHSLTSKETKKCKSELKQTKEFRVKASGNHMDGTKGSPSPSSSSMRDGYHSVSYSKSAVNSSLPPSPTIKHKKKKRKQIHNEVGSAINNANSGHRLKTLKEKLDLNMKVKSHKKGNNEDISTFAEIHNQERSAIKLVNKQTHLGSSHAKKNSQDKTSINLNCDKLHGKLHSHLKNKSENDILSKKKNKIKTRDATNLSQSIILGKRKRSLPRACPDAQLNVRFPPKAILSDGSNLKKLKKWKREGFGDTCENVDALSHGTSPQSSGISRSTACKKQEHSEHCGTSQKRGNKLTNDIDTVVDSDDHSAEMLPSNPSMMLHESRESHHLDGTRISISPQSIGAATMPKRKLTLREKMMEKLRGSRFRFLNEQMYSSRSEETSKFFQVDQEAFEAYHEGYKQQLMQWPVKPIDIIIKYLKKKPANYIIADFGCGDAQIAQSVPNHVHSFDHVALNKHVTVCDMSHTPLSNESVDVAIFCLSLMGNNLSDYVYEANRVLKIGGILKIAEVESRFDEVEKFIKVICKFGFLCIRRDVSNNVFYLFDFKKEKYLNYRKNLPAIELRACFYKKR